MIAHRTDTGAEPLWSGPNRDAQARLVLEHRFGRFPLVDMRAKNRCNCEEAVRSKLSRGNLRGQIFYTFTKTLLHKLTFVETLVPLFLQQTTAVDADGGCAAGTLNLRERLGQRG